MGLGVAGAGGVSDGSALVGCVGVAADAEGDGRLATTGAGSSTRVEMNSGEAMYQASGNATTRAGMATAMERRGCRLAAASQPRRVATTAMTTSAMTDPAPTRIR